MGINRRTFLSQLGMVSALSITPKTLMAMSSATLSTYQSFKQALANQPILIGYKNHNQEQAVHSLKIEGQFPEEVQGTFYRNGPALFERAGIRYDHLFEGDGMIHAFTFDRGKVAYQNRFVRTTKFNKESAANRFLYDFSDIGIPDSLPITSPDTINPANTNVLPVGDELWALWEAGSAHAIHPKTLETKGLVTLDSSLKGMPFSAHPKVDRQGNIWNFGLDYASGKVILYKLNGRGKMLQSGVVESNYHAMLHDFLITDRHILLILPSLKTDPEKASFMARQQFDPNAALRVMVIDKNDFKVKSQHEFPPGFVFHFGNAWENNDGDIHFDACLYPDLSIMETIFDVMKGKTSNNELAYSQTHLFTIKTNGQVQQTAYDGISEFPRIHPYEVGSKHKKVFTIGGKKHQQWMHSVRSLNLETGTVDEYSYGDDYLVEEHIVLPSKKRNHGGWLMGTALHWPSQKSCVSLFAADDIEAGPVARAWLPFHIPLGFHGNFKSNRVI